MVEKIIAEETRNTFCCEDTTLVGMIGASFCVLRNGLLVRASKIDGCLQSVVTVFFGSLFLMCSIIHQPVDIQVSRACITQLKMSSSRCTWRMPSIRRQAAVNDAQVIARNRNKKDTCNFFLRLDLSNASQWTFSDQLCERKTKMWSSM